MQVSATPTYHQQATALVERFAGHGAPLVDLHRPRSTAEFANTGTFAPVIDGYEELLPPVTTVELGGIKRGAPAITFVARLLERGSLFSAVQAAASHGSQDDQISIAELTDYLSTFDSTPADGVFELAQGQRLDAAFPEVELARGTQKMQW